jgi:replicative DNA helicase
MAKDRKSDTNKLIPADVRPPAAPDIEAAVLGACMLEKYAITKVIDILQPESFYLKEHQLIFDAMLGLFNDSKPIDTVTMYDELTKRLQINECGGAVYLSKLSQNISSAANVEHHALIIKEKQMLRGIIQSAHKMAASAYEGSDDAFEIIEEAEKAIFELTQFNSKQAVHIATATENAIKGIENKQGSDYKTGFYELDKLLLINKTDLIIIAARPGMGKSTLLYDILDNYTSTVINGKKNPVAIFSLEMGEEQLAVRGVAKESGIDYNSIYSGRYPAESRIKITSGINKVMSKDIYIDASHTLSLTELRSKARRLVIEKKIKLIGVDYLQLMHVKGVKEREREISMISRGCKALAKELEIPVIILCQLNRMAESRSDKRPLLSDLRESGSLEQDADKVLLIYRPEYYDIEKDEDGNSTAGIAFINIAKQRNGPTGEVKIGFRKQGTKFHNLETTHEPEQYQLMDTRYEPTNEDTI